MRVLVVEDEWLVALEMRLILEDLGHEVVGIAPDSRRAREIAAKGVDVATLDQFVGRHYDDYWLKTETKRQLEHMKLTAAAARHGRSFAVQHAS